MKTLSAFHDFLLPELPGCGVAMVNLQLVQVAREFCQLSSAWRLPFDPANLVAGRALYELDVPELQSEVVRLTELTINGEKLWQEAEFDDSRSDAESPKYPRHQPPFTLSADLLELTLIEAEVPTASVSMGLQATGAFKPTLTATSLPDFLKTQYSEALRYGVLSRLMLMGKKPWTDRDLAAVYDSRWQAALNFAAYQAQVGNTRQPLRVKKHG